MFVVAGMGGGTGSGASPVIARIAKEAGAVAVGVVTLPFASEGELRGRVARAGVQWLEHSADSVIMIPCEELASRAEGRPALPDSFLPASDMSSQAVRAVAGMITGPGLLCMHGEDLRAVLSERGIAVLGSASGEGENRSVTAMERAIANRVVDLPITDAPGLIVSFTCGDTLGLYEITEAVSSINRSLCGDAKFVSQAYIDYAMGDRVRVTFIATGFPSTLLWQERQTAVIGAPIELRMPTITEVV